MHPPFITTTITDSLLITFVPVHLSTAPMHCTTVALHQCNSPAPLLAHTIMHHSTYAPLSTTHMHSSSPHWHRKDPCTALHCTKHCTEQFTATRPTTHDHHTPATLYCTTHNTSTHHSTPSLHTPHHTVASPSGPHYSHITLTLAHLHSSHCCTTCQSGLPRWSPS
jgi:hypothetical protein